MLETIEIDHLRAWIGRQERGHDLITAELSKRFRATLDGYAEFGALPPLGIHWCLGLPAVPRDELGADGHPAKGGFLPPVPLPRRMWASSRLRFHQSPRPGASVERTSTIADIVLKHNAASDPLVFVHIDHLYLQTKEGVEEPLLEERQTIVYRRSAPYQQATLAETQHQPKNSGYSVRIVPDSTLLFRYSAVTFNGHRIHYDHHYTTSVEGYPGLVVHGPLMATLLMNLAQSSRPESPLQAFEFRGVAPTFVDQPLVLCARDHGSANSGGTESLEVRNQEGALIMTALARFGTEDAS